MEEVLEWKKSRNPRLHFGQEEVLEWKKSRNPRLHFGQASLLLFTLSDGAPAWYPTEAPTTEDPAPEDPMTTTGTWQRAAFKVVGEEKSAAPEEVAMELFDNMQHNHRIQNCHFA